MATLATRKNNPGNINVHSGQTYDNPLAGQAALYNDLTAKMTGHNSHGLGPNSSLLELINVWAPKGDNNNPTAYAADVANKLGVSPDTKLSELMPRIDDLAHAIAIHEGYQGQWAGGTGGNVSTSHNTSGNPNLNPTTNYTWQKSPDAPGAGGKTNGVPNGHTPNPVADAGYSAHFNPAKTIAQGAEALNQQLVNPGVGLRTAAALPGELVHQGKELLKGAASPELKGLVTGARTLQSTPDLAKGLFHALIGQKQKANQDLANANRTMKKPIMGQKTLAGSSDMENIQTALNAALQAAAVKAPAEAWAGVKDVGRGAQAVGRAGLNVAKAGGGLLGRLVEGAGIVGGIKSLFH